MFGKKRGDRAYSELTDNMSKYGVISQRVAPTNKIFYGTLVGVENSSKDSSAAKK